MSPVKNRFKDRMQDLKFTQPKKRKQVTWDDLLVDSKNEKEKLK